MRSFLLVAALVVFPQPDMSKKVRKHRAVAVAQLPPAQSFVPLPSSYRWEPLPESAANPYADPAKRTAYSVKSDPFAFAHEVGHILDEDMTDTDRRKFQKILRMKGPWDQGTGLGHEKSPSESFADYYAAAATNLDLRNAGMASYTQIGPKRLKRFKVALDQFGRARSLRQYGSDGVSPANPGITRSAAAQFAARP